MCVSWACAIFVMPVDLRARRSTIGCHWSLEQEAWQAFDNAGAELAALFQPLGQAHADHHADAIVEAYAPDAALALSQCSAGVRTTSMPHHAC